MACTTPVIPLNDYFDSAEVSIAVPGALSVNKGIVDPPNAQVSIGQELTYCVTVSLIEGTTFNVELVDELPDGTQLVGALPNGTVIPGSVEVITPEVNLWVKQTIISRAPTH